MKIAEQLVQVAGGNQFGSGLNDGDTTMAHLAVKAMIDIAQADDMTLTLLFIDVTAAFPIGPPSGPFRPSCLR